MVHRRDGEIIDIFKKKRYQAAASAPAEHLGLMEETADVMSYLWDAPASADKVVLTITD